MPSDPRIVLDELPPPIQRPGIGRIVHFMDRGHVCAAIVTGVSPEEPLSICCTVFLSNGLTSSYAGAQYDDSCTRHGTWRWPPRT